ncbi:MAG: DNA repair protein RadA [Fusobacteriota bacterium]
MAKPREYYVCTECGHESPKWLGRCPECGEWSTFEEEIATKKERKRAKKDEKNLKVYKFDDVEINENYRFKSEFQEFDRVLGGGLVQGEIVLLTGNPGVGKSTLLLQVLNQYSKKYKTLYISGEESIEQIKHRGDRLEIEGTNMYLMSETEIESIKNYVLKNRPKVIVIDSIQTIYSSEYNSMPGTTKQIRESALQIIEMAKKYNISFFIIGHITKAGKVAGPKLLEHMVDAVLNFEGEDNYIYRILRSVKNRFGSTNEIGIFNMKEDGIKEVLNSSEYFLDKRDRKNIGSIVVPVLEGNKTFLLEVQALATTIAYGNPKIVVQGLEYNRVQIIVAILEKRISLTLSNKDVYINVPGGISIKETSADLAVSLAIISTLKDVEVSNKVAAIGELGLRGEIRKVSFINKKLKELEKLGFKRVYLPMGNKKEVKKGEYSLKFAYLKNLKDLIERMD